MPGVAGGTVDPAGCGAGPGGNGAPPGELGAEALNGGDPAAPPGTPSGCQVASRLGKISCTSMGVPAGGPAEASWSAGGGSSGRSISPADGSVTPTGLSGVSEKRLPQRARAA